jgi:hypothetical protein
MEPLEEICGAAKLALLQQRLRVLPSSPSGPA